MRSYMTVVLVAALTVPCLLEAQGAPRANGGSPISLGVQLGIAMPTGEFRDYGSESGVGFGVEAAVHPSSRTALYLGYSDQTTSSGRDGYPDLTVDVYGLEAGVRVAPFPGPASPWIGGGLILKTVAASGSEEWGTSYSGESAVSPGWEISGGASLRLDRRSRLILGIRYQQLAERQTVEGEYLSFGVGEPVSWDVGRASLLLPIVGFSYRM